MHCIKRNFGDTKSYFTHYSCVVTFLFNADLCRTWHKITWKTIILSSLVLLLLKLFPKFRTKNNIPKCKAYIYQWQNFFSYKFRDHILSKNEEDDCVFVHTNQRCILETVRRLWWCFFARKLHHRCLTESQIHLKKKNMLGKLSFLCNAEKTRLLIFTWLPNWSFNAISLESNTSARCKAHCLWGGECPFFCLRISISPYSISFIPNC